MSAISLTPKWGDSMAQKTRVLIYCRLAHNDGMMMECQKDYLRRWAVENGYTVVDEITEVGSGTPMNSLPLNPRRVL